MTIKEKLLQVKTEFTTLKQKITAKFQAQQQTITDTNQRLNESNRQLELQIKENAENEKVLEQLLKEMKELTGQIG